MTLDFLAVGIMTPTESAISQLDLVNMFLPATSFTLIIMVNLIALAQRLPEHQVLYPPAYGAGTNILTNRNDTTDGPSSDQLPITPTPNAYAALTELPTS